MPDAGNLVSTSRYETVVTSGYVERPDGLSFMKGELQGFGVHLDGWLEDGEKDREKGSSWDQRDGALH